MADGEGTLEAIAGRAVLRLARETRPKLVPVINATGIVLHTNLGRAPIAEEAANAADDAVRGYLNLEMDLETGKRSSRQDALRDWVCRLTGAESATAVNNNAAATVLVLRAICQGKEVVISRGQLVEIGGSFRIPEIMAVQRRHSREVGATNITRLSDYEQAIGPNTGALLRFIAATIAFPGTRIGVAGRVGCPGQEGRAAGHRRHWLRGPARFRAFRFSRRADRAGQHRRRGRPVLFSGDKLLGGPQAADHRGSQGTHPEIEKDPLMRAFRLDKMSLAALETTLRLYLNEEQALRDVPVLRMLGLSLAELQQRAESLAVRLREIDGLATVKVSEDVAFVGGGSLPDQTMKTWVVEIEAREVSDAELAYRLRTGEPAVVGRVRDGKLVLDVRTVFVEQEAGLVQAIGRAVDEKKRTQ